MYRILIFYFLFTGTFFYFNFAYTQEAGLIPVKTSSSVHTTEFNIASGVITLYLPSDLTVAENASGTINFTSSSGTGNISQVLTAYNILVENHPIQINGNRFIIQVPVNLPTGVLSVALQEKNGKVLNRAFFPVRLTKRSALPGNAPGTSNFRTPVTSRSGMPSAINGPFDGDFSTSMISISGQPAVLLAESKRQLVFLVPAGLQGSKVLSLREGGAELKTPLTVLNVVKIGRDTPAIAKGYQNTPVSYPSTGKGEVLIESGQQFGKIDLDYKPDHGQDTPADSNLKPKMNKPPVVNRQQDLGPSINDLSKPLELDASELEKYNRSRGKQPDYSTNEFGSLKQFTDKPDYTTPDQKPSLSKSPAPSLPGTGKNRDISEVKSLLDSQINAPFTPFEDSTKTKTQVSSKKDDPQVKTATVEKTTKPLHVKKETVPKVVAKKDPVPVTKPKTPSPKKNIKEAPVATSRNVTQNNDKTVSKKPVKPDTKPVAKTRVAESSKKTEGVKVPKTEEIKPKPVETSEVENKRELKSKIPESLKLNTVEDKIDEKKETGKNGNIIEKKDEVKYKRINDLNSLNTSDSKFKSGKTVKKTGANTDSKGQIKEEEYVSLKKKEAKAPPKAAAAVKGNFAVQFASFKNKSEASGLVEKLNAQGYNVYFKKFKVPGKGYWYRVRKGGFSTRNEAEGYKRSLNLSRFHLGTPFVTVED